MEDWRFSSPLAMPQNEIDVYSRCLDPMLHTTAPLRMMVSRQPLHALGFHSFCDGQAPNGLERPEQEDALRPRKWCKRRNAHGIAVNPYRSAPIGPDRFLLPLFNCQNLSASHGATAVGGCTEPTPRVPQTLPGMCGSTGQGSGR